MAVTKIFSNRDAVEPNEPEGVVVDALCSGDEAAFRVLVSRLHPGLVRFACTYVPESLAHEIVQDTWVAVIRSIDTFEGRSSLDTWIYRIMLNKVRTLAKRESMIIPFAAMGHGSDDGQGSVDPERFHADGPQVGHWCEIPQRWESLPAEHLEGVESVRMIEAAIRGLPNGAREVVELRDVQGFSATEVCELLGITTVNQRVLLHRGRVAIRRQLERYLTDD